MGTIQQAVSNVRATSRESSTRLWFGFVLFSALSIVLYYLVDGDIQTVYYDFFGFFAVACIIVGIWRYKPDWPLPWALIAAGIFVLKMGDLVYAHHEAIFGRPRPFPSLAEGLLFVGNTIIFLAIFLVLRSREPRQDSGNVIDAAIIATTAAAFAWIFIMAPYASDESLTNFQLIAVLATPIYDLVTIVLLTRLVFGAGARTVSFYLLLVGMLSCLVADLLYSEITLHTTFETGDWLDLGWILWFLLYGAAALHPSMVKIGEPGPPGSERLSWNRLALLAIAALAVPFVALVQWQRDISINIPVVIGASAITFMLVVLRMSGLIRTTELARRDLNRSLDRERVLGQTSLGLVSASSAADVYESTAAALSGLAGDRAVGFVFEVDPQGELVNVAGTRPRTVHDNEKSVVSSLLSTSLFDRIDGDDEAITIDRASHEPIWRSLRLPSRLDIMTLSPVKIGADTAAVLGLASSGDESTTADAMLTTLGSQVSLALERVSLSERLHIRQSEERFHSMVENASDLILILDQAGNVTWASPSVMRVLEIGEAELLNRNVLQLVHPDDHRPANELMAQVLSAPGTVRSHDLRLQAGGRNWRSMEVTLNNLLEDASLLGIVANARDVTERKAAEEKLAQLAYFDPLTDLPNRARFTTMLNADIVRAKQTGQRTAVLFIDLDRFKLVNDSLGHEAGDALLRQAGQRISSHVRPEDTVARLGGDEFTVLISGFDRPDEPSRIAVRVLGAFTEPLLIGEREVFVDASIGIALVTHDVRDSGELLRRADIAMYRAKETGGQSIAMFDAEMGEHLLLRLDLETELRHAIDRDQLELYFQPEIDLKTNLTTGAEALLRWRHPRLGLVSPTEFIPLAEETGLILEIGRWVMRQSLQNAARWYERRPDLDLTLSVNLSVRQYLHLGIVEEISSLIRETSVPPSRVRLEITETILMDEKTSSRSVLERLDDLNVQLAIDDFGSGYSNLGYLKRLPVEALKIDQIFIRGLGHDPHDFAIVKAITELSHRIGLRVIAEGVETAEQLQIIREIGCDSAQGFFFAHPLPADEFSTWLEEGAWVTPASLAD